MRTILCNCVIEVWVCTSASNWFGCYLVWRSNVFLYYRFFRSVFGFWVFFKSPEYWWILRIRVEKVLCGTCEGSSLTSGWFFWFLGCSHSYTRTNVSRTIKAESFSLPKTNNRLQSCYPGYLDVGLGRVCFQTERWLEVTLISFAKRHGVFAVLSSAESQSGKRGCVD